MVILTIKYCLKIMSSQSLSDAGSRRTPSSESEVTSLSWRKYENHREKRKPDMYKKSMSKMCIIRFRQFLFRIPRAIVSCETPEVPLLWIASYWGDIIGIGNALKYLGHWHSTQQVCRMLSMSACTQVVNISVIISTMLTLSYSASVCSCGKNALNICI